MGLREPRPVDASRSGSHDADRVVLRRGTLKDLLSRADSSVDGTVRSRHGRRRNILRRINLCRHELTHRHLLTLQIAMGLVAVASMAVAVAAMVLAAAAMILAVASMVVAAVVKRSLSALLLDTKRLALVHVAILSQTKRQPHLSQWLAEDKVRKNVLT